MPYTLLASAVPLPACPTTFLDPASGVPTVSPALLLGDTTALLSKFNQVAARVDAGGRAGGGCYAIAFGLAISAGSGLNLTVASGQAVIDQVVTVATSQSVALTDNIARVYIWLSQTGALTSVNNSTTAPGAAYVFLGSAVTSGGAITSVDSSGVMKLLGSTLWRQTADATTPADSPGAALSFFNRGASNTLWFWDGTGYTDVNAGLATTSVILAPASTARNTVQATGAFVGLSLKAPASGTPDLLDFLDNTGAKIGAVVNSALLQLPDGTAGAPSHSFLSDTNTGVYRIGADILGFATGGTERLRIDASGHLTPIDGANLILNATTGMKIGTATTQKLAFFNSTPIVQPASTTDLRAALINLGLYASGGATPLDLNGGNLTVNAATINADSTLADGVDFAVGSTNGTKIGTATTQKLGFWNKAPVVQPAAYTPTNVSADRSYDANATTLDELADVVGTLIADMQSIGLIG